MTGIHLYVEEAEEGADFQSRMFAPLHQGLQKTLRPAAQMLLLSASLPICGLNLPAIESRFIETGRRSGTTEPAEGRRGKG